MHSDGGAFIEVALVEALGEKHGLDIVVPGPHEMESHLTDDRLERYSAIVVESNAVRHADSLIRQAIDQGSQAISRFVARGGGLLVLHQFLPNQTILSLPGIVEVEYVEYSGQLEPVTVDVERTGFQIPHAIPFGSTPPSATGSQLRETFSWLAIESSRLNGWTTAMRGANGSALVMLSPAAFIGHIAISAVPLDWHRWREPLVNLLRFVAVGEPSTVLWQNQNAVHGVAFDRAAIWPTQEARRLAALRPRPQLQLLDTAVPADGRCHVDPPEAEAVAAGIRAGGIAIWNHERSDGAREYRVEVGSASEKLASTSLREIQRSVLLESASREVFSLRNVLSSVTHFTNTAPVATATYDIEGLRNLVRRAEERYLFDRMTLTTVLTSIQLTTLVETGKSSSTLRSLSDKLQQLRPTVGDQDEVGLVAEAVDVLRGATTMDAWCKKVLRTSVDSQSSRPRLLDWIAFLVEHSDASIARPIAIELIEKWAEPMLGELTNRALSVEAKANVLLGFAALASQAEVTERLVIPAYWDDLDNWMNSEFRSEVGLVARAAHALSYAERHRVFGFARIWDVLGEIVSDEKWNSRQEVEQLSEQVRDLREANQKLSTRVTEMRTGHRLGIFMSWFGALGLAFGICVAGVFFTRHFDTPELLPWAFVLGALVLVGLARLFERRGLAPTWTKAPIDWIRRRVGD